MVGMMIEYSPEEREFRDNRCSTVVELEPGIAFLTVFNLRYYLRWMENFYFHSYVALSVEWVIMDSTVFTIVISVIVRFLTILPLLPSL
jgi:hypothetical protein